MGRFIYGPGTLTIELEDEVLVHLQTLLSVKLRRGESFFLSWRDSKSSGGGRSSVWVEPAIQMSFRYGCNELPQVHKEWLEEMMIASMRATGLDLSDEDACSHPTVARSNSVKSKASSLV